MHLSIPDFHIGIAQLRFESLHSPRMKVLFDHPDPFMLAHGGFQIQIEQSKSALESVGVDVEWLRWWDDAQKGDLIHYFGRPNAAYLDFAQDKGIRMVIAPLLTGMGSRSRPALLGQKIMTAILRRVLPGAFASAMGWEAFRRADACLALTAWQKHLMSRMFGAPPERVHVVPNGVEEIFFNAPAMARGRWLICTATLTARKRVLELAEAAVRAQTPVWIIGNAYAKTDPYARRFFALAQQHPDILRYEGPLSGREKLAQAYRQARGFVLLSSMESLSLSALEAAACGCPLLLSDLPWARSTFGAAARYCPLTSSVGKTAAILRAFYDAAPDLPPPPKPATWMEIGQQIKTIYEQVLSTSR